MRGSLHELINRFATIGIIPAGAGLTEKLAAGEDVTGIIPAGAGLTL